MSDLVPIAEASIIAFACEHPSVALIQIVLAYSSLKLGLFMIYKLYQPIEI